MGFEIVKLVLELKECFSEIKNDLYIYIWELDFSAQSVLSLPRQALYIMILNVCNYSIFKSCNKLPLGA